jgi:hypothetical protein
MHGCTALVQPGIVFFLLGLMFVAGFYYLYSIINDGKHSLDHEQGFSD